MEEISCERDASRIGDLEVDDSKIGDSGSSTSVESGVGSGVSSDGTLVNSSLVSIGCVTESSSSLSNLIFVVGGIESRLGML